jgi:hypothetical protein
LPEVLTSTAKVIQTFIPCEVGIFADIPELSLRQEEQVSAVERLGPCALNL